MKVLLATDGSENSLAAEQFLANFPFESPPELVLAHVTPIPMADVSHVFEQYCREGDRLLHDAAHRCSAWAGPVERRMLSGHAPSNLIRAAEEVQADVIVMGARGMGGVKRFLLGSTSDAVAKHASCSVLIVRMPEEEPIGPLKEVVIATDESGIAGNAIRRFAQLPLPADCAVTVMSVLVQALPAYDLVDLLIPTSELAATRKRMEQSLADAAAEFKKRNIAVNTMVHEGANAADEILKTAHDLGADLIVVGSTGLSGWERLLLGSVSLRILHHAHCSVWIERPRPV